MLEKLIERSGGKCELCGSTDALDRYVVAPAAGTKAEECAYLCQHCQEQIDHPQQVDVNHWRCLNDSMWSQEPAVQVLAWRMLTRLSDEGWPRDLLDMLYLDDATLDWAQAQEEPEAPLVHRDCNGAQLSAGDTVILIKDLNVKGAGFTAKRGTAVRGIALVSDDAGQIEGRVNGQRIVILTQFVKKS